MQIFLDSGAFSAWNSKKNIDLDAYIAFCKKYEKDLDMIATLDVIPGEPNKKLSSIQVEEAAKKGYKNYEKMLSRGITQEKLLHTFHQGDPEKWLEKLVKEGGPYIGISPANDKTSSQRKEWMDKICVPIILDSQRNPKINFHGFAVTSLKLVFGYPWYSVDSSSWQLRGGGYGLLDLPCTPALTKKEHYYIRSIPISKGLKKYKENENKMTPLFSLNKISQCDASFLKSPSYKKEIEELLSKYEFTLKELQNDSRLRAVWNAIYLITSISKFTNTILYLTASDFKAIHILCKKMQAISLDTNNLNFLISFASISAPNLNKLIRMKNHGKII